MRDEICVRPRKRNEFIDALRGLVIILVVYAHALQRSNGMSSNNSVHLIIQTFQMVLLMAISGYCAGFGEPVVDATKAFISTVKRLLIPYLIWEQIHFFLNIFVGHVEYSVKKQLFSILLSDFWFLRILFLIKVAYLCFWSLYNYARKNKTNIYVCVIIGGVGGVVTLYAFSQLPGCSSVISYCLAFLMGNAFFKVNKKWGCKRIIQIISVIGASVFLLSAFFYQKTDGFLHLVLDKSMAITGCLFFLLIGSVVIQLLRSWKKTFQLLLYVGRRTLSIYSIHWVLLFSFGIIDYNALVISGFSIYFVALFVAIIWISICYICLKAFDAVKIMHEKRLTQ